MDGRVLTDETKDLIVKVGDQAIKLPFWAEPFDGPVLNWLVNYVDKKGDKVIPDDIDPLINSAIKAGLGGDWDVAEVQIATAFNKLVDIPLLDEDAEQSLLKNATKVIVDVIKMWIEKSKEK